MRKVFAEAVLVGIRQQSQISATLQVSLKSLPVFYHCRSAQVHSAPQSTRRQSPKEQTQQYVSESQRKTG